MGNGVAILLRGGCLLTGYLLGSFLTAETVARCTVGTHVWELGNGTPGLVNILQTLGVPAGVLVLVGDAVKTALACWLCYHFAAPELGLLGMLYAGLGATIGHCWPLRQRLLHGGKGVAVTCTWLALGLPVTGVLCCLAGGMLVLWRGYLPLGAVIIPLLAVPTAWIQFGPESAAVVAVAAAIMLWRHRQGLARIKKGEEPDFFHRR